MFRSRSSSDVVSSFFLPSARKSGLLSTRKLHHSVMCHPYRTPLRHRPSQRSLSVPEDRSVFPARRTSCRFTLRTTTLGCLLRRFLDIQVIRGINLGHRFLAPLHHGRHEDVGNLLQEPERHLELRL